VSLGPVTASACQRNLWIAWESPAIRLRAGSARVAGLAGTGRSQRILTQSRVVSHRAGPRWIEALERSARPKGESHVRFHHRRVPEAARSRRDRPRPRRRQLRHRHGGVRVRIELGLQSGLELRADAVGHRLVVRRSATLGPPQRSDETPLTGDTLASVRAAAVAEVGSDATVVRVETDADGHAAYEAHMVKADGTPVTVYVDKSFDVVSVESR
jgi:hypothetical protein